MPDRNSHTHTPARPALTVRTAVSPVLPITIAINLPAATR